MNPNIPDVLRAEKPMHAGQEIGNPLSKSQLLLLSVISDAVTVVFVLASFFIAFGKHHSFRSLDYALDVPLLPYSLISVALLVLIRLLHHEFRNSPIFTLLPGLAGSIYLNLTLFEAPQVSYCIGLLLLVAAVTYMLFPVYTKIRRQHNRVTGVLIWIQIGLLAMLCLVVVYRIMTRPDFVNTDREYKELFVVLTAVLLMLIFSIAYGAMVCYSPRRLQLTGRKHYGIIAFFALLNLFLLGGLLVVRVVALKTPTYDFGIFAQMFHYMDKTGLPLTTLERNGLLSHFSIHLSPIYYLLLPFYKIFPGPETLQILQVLVVLSGVVPLLMLCRHFNLKKSYQIALSIIYLFHPAIIGSSLYDLHENCFLAPLILWLFYFLEKDRRVQMVITAILIFLVKEDAMMYVVLIGFFMLVSGKRKKQGVLLMILGVSYFLIAVYFLSNNGNGVMFYRYDNLIADKSWGLPGIILTILLNPGYLFSEMLIPRKIIFILTVFPAMGMLPVMQRKYSRLLLLLPLLVMNLMPGFSYQYLIPYQYHYATTTIMVYMILLFLADANFAKEPQPISPVTGTDAASGPVAPVNTERELNFRQNAKRPVVIAALCLAVISCAFFTTELFASNYYPVEHLSDNANVIRGIKEELDKIPRDASIQASGYFTTYLSDRDIVYYLEFNRKDKNPHETDYVVVDRRVETTPEIQYYIDGLLEKNYTNVVDIPGQILILQKQ